MHEIKERDSCRVCFKRELEPIISLGEQYVVDFLDSSKDDSIKANLDLVLCNKKDGGCGLLQLKHTVPGDLLYQEFWYKSGVNQSMIDALKNIVENIEKRIGLDSQDIIIDIGANDGTLLRQYKQRDHILVGFEPAKNLIKDAKIGNTKIINDFFNFESFNKEFPGSKAKVITSISMFYDLEDPNSFVSDIKKSLQSDGIWVIQQNYLVTMLLNDSFDNIVHEHLEYYSLSTLKNLLERHKLKIFDVEFNDLNGGSIRTYIKHDDCKKYPIRDIVLETLEHEKKMGLGDDKPYIEFAKRILNLKAKTVDFIKKEVKSGKKVYVYGASTRGNALLQYYELDNKMIKAAADRNPIKWGKRIVGSDIPIISEEQARKEKPDYFLVLPWYFIDEFKKREEEFLNNGGKMIVPLPEFKIIGKN
jgi:2-polyprenyl-3-methyl-5-hydroxy-6-metoxy-1,4-benzoquinol methylase